LLCDKTEGNKKMRKKIYYLATCSTCAQILKQVKPGPDVEMQDIKTQVMTGAQVDEMKAMAGTYEALFSRRALKYKEMGLGSQKLTEPDYRRLILEEYTFLKRPVMLLGDRIFVGNAPKTVDEAVAAFQA
jgi:arsenate reductase (glutaredoxin)